MDLPHCTNESQPGGPTWEPRVPPGEGAGKRQKCLQAQACLCLAPTPPWKCSFQGRVGVICSHEPHSITTPFHLNSRKGRKHMCTKTCPQADFSSLDLTTPIHKLNVKSPASPILRLTLEHQFPLGTCLSRHRSDSAWLWSLQSCSTGGGQAHRRARVWEEGDNNECELESKK